MILVAIVLFIRSPWGQGIIVDKVTAYVSGKTDTKMEIEKLFITFSGNMSLKGLYLEDLQGDTLLYSKNIETGIGLWPLIRGGEIHISKLEWEGLVANVARTQTTGNFNFDFLVKAFAADERGVVEDKQIPSEETASPMSISIGPIVLRDFNLNYRDEVAGMDASVQLGAFDLDIPHLDLDKFEFYVRNLVLMDSRIYYHQSKPFEPDEEIPAGEPILPVLIVDDFVFKNVEVLYNNDFEKQKANVKIGELQVEIPEADLKNQKLLVKSITLNQSAILFHDFSEKMVREEMSGSSAGDSIPFSWPDWEVELGNLAIENSQLEYKTKDQDIIKGYFNPEVIVLDALNLQVDNAFLKNEQTGLNLREFTFRDGSGFHLKEFSFNLKASDTGTQLKNLLLSTDRSNLDSDIELQYTSITELIDFPDRSNFDFSVNQLKVDIRDSYFFDPDLAKDEMIRKLAVDPFELQLKIHGGISQLEIPVFELNWGTSTFVAYGNAEHVTDMDLLSFDFPEMVLNTNRQTLLKFVDEQDLGIQLPDQIDLKTSASGRMDDLLASLDLETELGRIVLEGKFQSRNFLAFEADLKIMGLQLGVIMDNPQLDTLSFQIQASGSGTGLEDLNARLNSTFERLHLYGNDYSGLGLEGQLVNGVGDARMWLEDEFLDFELLAKMALDSASSKIDLTLDLKGADFFELGLSPEILRAKLLFNAQFEGNPTNFDLQASLNDASVLYDQRNYPLGGLNLIARIREDSTSMDIKSIMLNGSLRSNTSPEGLAEAITLHFRQFLDEQDSVLEHSGAINMSLDLKVNQAPVLNQVLLQGLDQLDTVRMSVDFNQSANTLKANVDLPYVKYGEAEIDSLRFRIHSDQENLDLSFGFLALTSGPLSMDKTFFTGKLQESRLHFDFNSFDGDERMVHVASDIGLRGDTLSIHIDPDDLLLNKRTWQIPGNNQILVADSYLHFEEFRFFRNQQELIIRDDLEEISEEHLAVQFKDFRLETFTSLLNPDELIADGLLNGQLIVENPFGATGLLANFRIDSLKALDIQLGDLTLDAESKTKGNYQINLALKGGGVDLDLKGDFAANESGGSFDLDLDLNKIEMEVLAGLSGGELREASGYISGNIYADGTTNEPKYTGDIRFNQAVFTVSQLNSKFLLSDEKISMDNEGIFFDQFTFQDSENNRFSIDGSIFTESYTNPTFDLKLNAANFRVINSTRDDNDIFFGNGIIDADVTFRGDLNLPVVVARLKVKDGTNLTVIIPESQLDLVMRDGVVIFVNRQDPDDILTRRAEESTSGFVGYDIRAILEVDPSAAFRVIVDERSGDNLMVSGLANLNLEINPNGRITLSGNYEIRKGHYEMSLYNVVSRRFDIAEGSMITWNGDPMDATLSISAIYNIKTASSELMASQLTGSNLESRTQYLQELPFMVYLNVNGELLRPEISFRLDMPQDQRGALGGNVYSRVLQVNEQEDELNKQVFSLLVLNRFFPSGGSDGSGGGTSAIARNSVSQVLSGQLNALSSNLLGGSGLELDFDLDSFTDYQSGSAQDRTQLNVSARKRMMDDRLVVQVGSQMDIEGSSQNPDQTNAVLGNISVEYLLTENGRYRLRAFRRNQFESIIDGQLIVTGIGLIFNREFNRFLELWRGIDLGKDGVNPIEEIEKQNRNNNNKKNAKPDSGTPKKEEHED